MFNSLSSGRYDKKIITTPNKITVLLLTTLLLSGCLAAPVKLSQAHRQAIKNIRIAIVEAPPLQIIPDQLQERMPVYGHYDNMVLPVAAATGVYRQPGGITVAGLVGEGDSVEVIDPAYNPKSAGWSPSMLLRQEAVRLLNEAEFQVKTADDEKHLQAITFAKLNLGQWQDDTAAWYENNREKATDYGTDADAVLELAVGQYRIFEGQIALQVLMKLIDAQTGDVLARIDEKSTAYEASISELLAREGNRFKSALRKKTRRLLAKGFHDIGLTAY